jgi:sugar phosphate isomerase/epimerase
MRFGLVTYLWGEDWDLPALLTNCEAAGLLGVELRTTHKHGVEPSLSKAERGEVQRRFADSPVEFVGPGSDEKFHWPQPERVRRAIDTTKEFLVLSHDLGGSGVKVKPDGFPAGVPRERTIEQIGRALNELGAFAKDLGQEVRLEVHGRGTQELPNIQAIMKVADHRNAVVCWNSNAEDLLEPGLAHNFALVKDRFGQTLHVRELDQGDYPYGELIALLVAMDYRGWVLLEARTKPADRVAAMRGQRAVFEKHLARAQK